MEQGNDAMMASASRARFSKSMARGLTVST